MQKLVWQNVVRRNPKALSFTNVLQVHKVCIKSAPDRHEAGVRQSGSVSGRPVPRLRRQRRPGARLKHEAPFPEDFFILKFSS
jgi:hypothetical protein